MGLQRWLNTLVRSGELNRRRAIRTVTRASWEVRVWNFLRLGSSPTTKGWVWMKKWERPGGRGTLFRFEALRVLAETEAELRRFRFRGEGVAVHAMLGYNRDYNRRVRRLLMRGVSPYYAHRQVASAMDREGRMMLLSMVTQLACAVAGAAGTSGGVDAGASGAGMIPAQLQLQSAGSP